MIEPFLADVAKGRKEEVEEPEFHLQVLFRGSRKRRMASKIRPVTMIPAEGMRPLVSFFPT